jgi:hypothetical protein
MDKPPFPVDVAAEVVTYYQELPELRGRVSLEVVERVQEAEAGVVLVEPGHRPQDCPGQTEV